jgi:hypothetical protein
MLVVTIVTARLLVLRLAVPSTPSARLGIGVHQDFAKSIEWLLTGC